MKNWQWIVCTIVGIFFIRFVAKLIIDPIWDVVKLLKEINKKLQWVLEYQKRQLYPSDYKGFQPTDETANAIMGAISEKAK